MSEKKVFNSKSVTKSYSFLFPMLQIDKIYLNLEYLINVYLFNDDFPEHTNVMYLHYEYTPNYVRCEQYFKNHKDYLGYYEPDEYTCIFYFKIPEKWIIDYFKILDGKYSTISLEYKHIVCRFFNANNKSEIYKILFRDIERRKQLEETLHVELPANAELASIFNFEQERYTDKHKIINPLELNYMWESR